jgi:UDPglucose 6-dehydrogenase
MTPIEEKAPVSCGFPLDQGWATRIRESAPGGFPQRSRGFVPNSSAFRDSPSRIAVVGAGYVGVTTAVCLVSKGHTVVCADNDGSKVDRLSRGLPTFFEEGLGQLLNEGLSSGQLRFVTTAAASVRDANFIFICVSTPARADGSPDIGALETVASEIGPHLTPGAVVVNKSTVPIGSTVLVERLIARDDVTVVSNPEFLREGTAIQDCLHPARVVVGGKDPSVAVRVGRLLSADDAPLILTDAPTAEMIKYASNAFLATKLSFANAVSDLCERVGADVGDVIRGMGLDPRIGPAFLNPGPGWGGSCLPKDTQALIFMAKQAGFPFPLLEETLRSNEAHLNAVVAKIRNACEGVLGGTVTAAWGLTFKAGTDDLRESPALEVLRLVAREGGRVRAFDPTTIGRQLGDLPDVEVHDDPYSACQGAKVLAVLTEWPEFRSVDMAKVFQAMAPNPTLVDTRNLLDPEEMRNIGFNYVGSGRS